MSEPSPELLPELACYGLPGHAEDPADLLGQLADAERIGLGSVFISERFNIKEAGALTGASVVASRHLGIATGVTNINTRHPMVTASWAMTLHRLSQGRFALGIGRGIPASGRAYGIPPSTMAQMEDAFGLMRRLWAGETVVGHSGPSGSYPVLRMGAQFHDEIPIMVAALGPKTMRWAGRVADGVILHTFFSDEALARCVAEVRAGAEEAGRDPQRVRVWSVLATLEGELDEHRRLKSLVGRMATYLQVYGDALVAINQWDPAVLTAFRSDAVVKSVPGAIDAVATWDQLSHIETLIPEHWYPAAVGSAEVCARRVVDQFDQGADGVILHGATPLQLETTVAAYRTIRPAGRFDGRHVNPGR